MLSNMSYSILPFDIPVLPDTSAPNTEDDPFALLNFDDLLDIACEFEFTRTINHIWPCEEEPNTCPDRGLDDLLAAVVPTPNAGESPVPLASSAPSVTIDPVHVQEVDLFRSTSRCPAPDANASIPVSLPKEVRTEAASTLQGWSPPNGSQFLDLDDSLMLPQPAKDTWNAPWLARLLASSSSQPMNDMDQAFATISVQPQTPAISLPKLPPISTADKSANDPRKKSVPIPVQPAIPDPVRVRSAAQTSPNIPSQKVVDSHAKTSKSRPAMGGTSKYARAPRGGIPPHIARSVTKANVLRVEKERKVMQDAFSSTVTGEIKIPSVLQRVAKVEKGASKNVNGGGSRKKPFALGENDKKEGRAAKRARV